jgi:hypothetical protein
MCGARVVMRFVVGNSDLQHTWVRLGRLGFFVALLYNNDVMNHEICFSSLNDTDPMIDSLMF